ncbi:hypothetical protein P879_02742 [Paragonimus westermani]|uniref:Kinesin-like protein n=1 Tax=Paragonimus westermani TaxID=34504 RepID=A0A8T0D0R3_9TREM|nr:hypothetical protein P879_02742 [Paragonimus westermani]
MPKPGVVRLLPKRQPDLPAREFIFDHTFWSFDKRPATLGDCSTIHKPDFPNYADQATVYKAIGIPILLRALEGYNACLFAYGMTSSGKTYSITGPTGNPGIIPRLVDDLFRRISEREVKQSVIFQVAVQSLEAKYSVELSYFEIYNERIRDLLSNEKTGPNGSVPFILFTYFGGQLVVHEHPVTGPYVEGLCRVGVHSATDIKGWIRAGDRQRTVANTEFNERSSRAHTVLTLYLTRRTVAKCTFGDMIESVYTSQLNVVDLAGSERQGSSTIIGDRLNESCQINKSLLALGRVISQLSRCLPNLPNIIPASEPRPGGYRKKAVNFSTPNRVTVKRPFYIPYRDSLLTWLLKDSLGGNAMTTMLATISPSSLQYEETLATLRYAKKAQSIVNSAIINEDPQGRVIRQLMTEVVRLREVSSVYAEPGSPQAFEVATLRELLILKEKDVRELSRQLTERTLRHNKLGDAPTYRKSVETESTTSQQMKQTRADHVDRATSPIRSSLSNSPLGFTCQLTPLRRSVAARSDSPSHLQIAVSNRPGQDVATETVDTWSCNREDHDHLVCEVTRLKSELSMSIASNVSFVEIFFCSSCSLWLTRIFINTSYYFSIFFFPNCCLSELLTICRTLSGVTAYSNKLYVHLITKSFLNQACNNRVSVLLDQPTVSRIRLPS